MTRIYAILAAIGAALLVVVGVFTRGSKAGKDSVKAKQAEKTIENVEKGKRARRDADPGKLSRFDR